MKIPPDGSGVNDVGTTRLRVQALAPQVFSFLLSVSAKHIFHKERCLHHLIVCPTLNLHSIE